MKEKRQLFLIKEKPKMKTNEEEIKKTQNLYPFFQIEMKFGLNCFENHIMKICFNINRTENARIVQPDSKIVLWNIAHASLF
jgi:hypothetical protein